MPQGRRQSRRLKGKSEAKKPDVEAEVVEDDISQWPTRAEAAKIVGVHPRTIKRWEDSGELDSAVDDLGYHRFKPEDLEALRGQRGDAGEAMAQTVSAIVEGATSLTGQAQGHADKFADKVVEMGQAAFDAMKSANDDLREENKDLRERIKELETDRREAYKEAENARGKAHERKIESDKIEREEKRIDWALQFAAALAGPILLKKFGIADPSSTTPPSLPSGPTIAEAQAEQKDADKEVPTTVGRLRELELQVMILIGEMDKQKFDGLIMFASPKEKEALTEIRGAFERIKKTSEKKE